MKKMCIDPSLTQYKANLHCHSTASDGRYTPEKLREIYAAQGYSVLAYSDHNVLTPHQDLQTDTFLPLDAIEINCNIPSNDWASLPTYHLNFFSPTPDRAVFVPTERTYTVECVNALIARATKAGFLAMYNHPRWSFQDIRDFLPLEDLWGFEVYNHGCQIEMQNGYAEYEYEEMLRNGKYLIPVATDDNHNACQDENSPYNDSFGGFSMISAQSLTYDSIFNALKEGNTYASTGPVISAAWIEDDTVHIECSPCEVIAVLTDSRASRVIRTFGDTQTVADIKLDFGYRYFRIECIDAHGHKAMTQAFLHA